MAGSSSSGAAGTIGRSSRRRAMATAATGGIRRWTCGWLPATRSLSHSAALPRSTAATISSCSSSAVRTWGFRMAWLPAPTAPSPRLRRTEAARRHILRLRHSPLRSAGVARRDARPPAQRDAATDVATGAATEAADRAPCVAKTCGKKRVTLRDLRCPVPSWQGKLADRMQKLSATAAVGRAQH